MHLWLLLSYYFVFVLMKYRNLGASAHNAYGQHMSKNRICIYYISPDGWYICNVLKI